MAKKPQTDPRYHDIKAKNCRNRAGLRLSENLTSKCALVVGRECPACAQ